MSQRFPGAAVHLNGRYGGTMDGYRGIKKVVLHTEGVKRDSPDALNLARYVHAKNIGYHAIYEYGRDRFVTLYDINVGARAMSNNGTHAAGPNKRGQYAYQLCWAGELLEIPTDKPMKRNWIRHNEWLQSMGIPQVTVVNWERPKRSWSDFEESGWVGHCHAPSGNDHTDGTGTKVEKLWTPRGDIMEYGQLKAANNLVIPGGESRWVEWPGQKKSWHPKGSSNLLIEGVMTATVEHKATGPINVSFVQIDRKTKEAAGGGDNHHCQSGWNLTTNVMKIRGSRKLRIRVTNRGQDDVVVDRLQFRASWCNS